MHQIKTTTAPDPQLPADFITFWLGLCAQKPSAVNAHCALLVRLRRWRAGDETAALPGYPEPPAAQYTELPAGWDLPTLRGLFLESSAMRQRGGTLTSHRYGALPLPFVTWFTEVYLAERGRFFAPIYRNLLARADAWRDGDGNAAIPGYDAPPPSGTYFRGWSYGTLLRLVQMAPPTFAKANPQPENLSQPTS